MVDPRNREQRQAPRGWCGQDCASIRGFTSQQEPPGPEIAKGQESPHWQLAIKTLINTAEGLNHACADSCAAALNRAGQILLS